MLGICGNLAAISGDCYHHPDMNCTERKASGKATTLADLVAEFLEQDGCCPRDELDEFRGLKIKEAIRKAAQARDKHGRIHSHQKWLRQETADKSQEILLKCAVEIMACQDFDTLHTFIKSKLQINGLNEMYWYDTAFRIGISMGIYPQKVYLHRGTRTGANALGIYRGVEVLEMSDLPIELQIMKPYQVEAFLCIKKNILFDFRR